MGAAESYNSERERCETRKFGLTAGFPAPNSGVPSQGSGSQRGIYPRDWICWGMQEDRRALFWLTPSLAEGHPGHALIHRVLWPISAALQFLEVQECPGQLGRFLGLSCAFSCALTQSVCLNCGAEGAPRSQVWALHPVCVSKNLSWDQETLRESPEVGAVPGHSLWDARGRK